MGGKDKGCDYRVLRDLVKERVKELLLIGEGAGRIESELKQVIEPMFFKTLEETVEYASKRAVPGDVVLLSPACSSFDMFRDYHHRGEVFRETVKNLTAENAKHG